MRRLSTSLVVVALTVFATAELQATTIAYEVPANTVGNQSFSGALGMHFSTNHVIIVRELGAFDSGSNGLAVGTTLTTKLWNKTPGPSELAAQTFTNADPGTLVGGSRFKPLPAPLFLPRGFQGVIATGGYGGAEPNGNSPAPSWTTHNGGGLINFVSPPSYGLVSSTAYPSSVDGAPANRYAAGTLSYEAANIAYEVSSGATGSQEFGGSLGMDFQVNHATKITHLGVFDSGSDGLGRDITAQLYARSGNTGTLLAELTFPTGNTGELIGGSRFLPIENATFFNGFDGVLTAGTTATIAASNYGEFEPLGNTGAFTGSKSTFDGFGLLTFQGGGRFSATSNVFPGTPDGGPADRYAAGTFRFVAVPEPSTFVLLGLGIGTLVWRGTRKRR